MPGEATVEVLAVRTHGRYLIREAKSDAGGLLVALHGYGMSGAGMLAAVETIPGIEGWTVVSIQGLSRFYDRRTREVVASWMTRQDRELAIADNITFVGDVVRRAVKAGGKSRPLVYLGFSQGTAMAYRAAAGVDMACDGVVALGGDVPPELAGRRLTSGPRVMIGRGLSDEWYDEEKLEADLQVLSALGCEAEVVRFAGGHEWTDEFRLRCEEFLASLATAG